jgi:hypothetical protein
MHQYDVEILAVHRGRPDGGRPVSEVSYHVVSAATAADAERSALARAAAQTPAWADGTLITLLAHAVRSTELWAFNRAA